MLKVTANWNEAKLRKDIEVQIEAYFDNVVKIYSDVLVDMTEDARGRTKVNGASFGNITWNLRSSIGGGVYRGGQKKFSYFPVLQTGSEGAKTGEDYADYIANLVTESSEIVLVFVAGMEYAYAVEARGLNVITGTVWDLEMIMKKYL